MLKTGAEPGRQIGWRGEKGRDQWQEGNREEPKEMKRVKRRTGKDDIKKGKSWLGWRSSWSQRHWGEWVCWAGLRRLRPSWERGTMKVAKERLAILALRLAKEDMMDCMDSSSDWVKVTRRNVCHNLDRISKIMTVTRPCIVKLRVECTWHVLQMWEMNVGTKENRCWRLSEEIVTKVD